MRKDWGRYSFESLAGGVVDAQGRIFIGPEQVDLVGVRIIHSGVDTLRVLYSGRASESEWNLIERAYGEGFNQVYELLGVQWLLGSGGKSGYRWRLQNNELGVIIFFGSRHALGKIEGAHLKVELSPHFIYGRGEADIDKFLGKIKSALLAQATGVQFAVHMALDVQGWEPAHGFERALVTRSKRAARWDGIERVEIDSSGACAVYGDRETFLFGSASGLQLCVYRKDVEARKRGKYDYWEQAVWQHSTDVASFPESNYRVGEPVWRIEYRLHHTVVGQLLAGTGKTVNTFAELVPHLKGFWRYACATMRLDHSRTYIDPFWQLIRDEADFRGKDHGLMPRRVYRKPGSGSAKNLALALGNLLTIYVRQGFTVDLVMKYIRQAGIWGELVGWFDSRGMGEDRIREYVEKAMLLRRLGRAA